jgi:integrase
LKAGRPYDLNGWVFCRPDGRPLSMNRVYKSWLRVCAKAGIPPIRFHDLRHTAATLLFSQDIHIKVVSEMLGTPTSGRPGTSTGT